MSHIARGTVEGVGGVGHDERIEDGYARMGALQEVANWTPVAANFDDIGKCIDKPSSENLPGLKCGG